jgi:PAS domain-containing protein
MIGALKRLGFWGVSETALGAQEVSAGVARLMNDGPPRLLLSSACPTVVAWMQKHQPQSAGLLTGLLSPLLTHCRMLRQTYGQQIGIVFVGPCIAKKSEADATPDLLDVALTFEDLRRWFEQEKIDPHAGELGGEDHRMIPRASDEGRWYPVDGGMIAGIKANCAVHDDAFMSFSGLSSIQRALQGAADLKLDKSIFVELLACEGGCVNGPKTCRGAGTVARRARVLRYGSYPDTPVPRTPAMRIDANLAATPIITPAYPDGQIREALRQVGKLSPDDELNCGGCGYDSCRQFATALIDQKAERTMCVTYMRKLAQKKANALIQKMPSAVVIVNDALRVLECSAAFVKLVGQAGVGDGSPVAMEGRLLADLLPFYHLFASVLKTGEDIVDRDLHFRNTILHMSIFNIEKHVIVGGIMQDVTKPAVQKEQVIRKAQEVIQRNLSTVQKIAYLLGENAAESEITLNSIIDSFSPPKLENGEGGPGQGPGHDDWTKRCR